MSTRTKRSRPCRRTTMALTGSLRHAEVRLSFQSLAGARLTVQHLARSHALRPTLSAVTRQALLHYASQVEAMSPDERAREAICVHSASKAHLPPADDMERAFAAIETAGEGGALPTLTELVFPSTASLDLAGLEDRTTAMLKAPHPRRFAHL